MAYDDTIVSKLVNDLWVKVARDLFNKPIGSKRTRIDEIRLTATSKIVKVAVQGEVVHPRTGYPTGSLTTFGRRGVILGHAEITQSD